MSSVTEYIVEKIKTKNAATIAAKQHELPKMNEIESCMLFFFSSVVTNIICEKNVGGSKTIFSVLLLPPYLLLSFLPSLFLFHIHSNTMRNDNDRRTKNISNMKRSDSQQRNHHV